MKGTGKILIVPSTFTSGAIHINHVCIHLSYAFIFVLVESSIVWLRLMCVNKVRFVLVCTKAGISYLPSPRHSAIYIQCILGWRLKYMYGTLVKWTLVAIKNCFLVVVFQKYSLISSKRIRRWFEYRTGRETAREIPYILGHGTVAVVWAFKLVHEYYHVYLHVIVM